MSFLPNDGFVGGPAGWYRSTGETTIATGGNLAVAYRDEWHPEPIWAPIIGTPRVEAPAPRGLYLYESFLWVAPPHGPVKWDSVRCVIETPTVPPTSVPEPRYGWILGIALILIVSLYHLRKADRKKWGGK